MSISATNGSTNGVCTTPECIHIASELLWSLAPNYTDIDPCTDFHEFACNGWKNRHEVPGGQLRAQTLGEANDLNRYTIKRILEGPYPSGAEVGWITVNLTEAQKPADHEIFDKMQNAYEVCLNQTTQARVGVAPLTAFLETVLTTFPATPSTNLTRRQAQDKSKEIGNILAYYESLGIGTFQRIVTNQDDTDPDTIIPGIQPVAFSDMPKSQALSFEYLEVGSALLSAAHPANVTIAEAAKRLQSVFQFQTKVTVAIAAARALESANRTDDMPQPKMTLTELQSQAPQLNYEYVLSTLVPSGYKPDQMIVSAQSYYKNVSSLISETDSQTLQDFFVWRGVVALAPYLIADESDDFNRFIIKNAGRDPDSQQQNWRDCVDYVDNGVKWLVEVEAYGPSGVTWILSRFFLDRTYSREAQQFTDKLLQTLQAEFIDRLEEKDWISEQVKKVATDKVNTVMRKIGFPSSPDAIDPLKLQEYYQDLDIGTSHFANAVALAKFSVAKSYVQLGQPVDRGTFFYSVPTVNAYYNPQLNEIVIFAGIQQFPVFDVAWPAYLAYGGMGGIVGHELTHGFDDSGRRFDPTGNFTAWWDEQTVKNFVNRTQCFIEQYGEFTITAPNGTEVHVLGEPTLGENIADAGGLSASFGAWKRWEEEQGKKDQQLPGLENFTNEQLFFLKWAHGWCDVTPPAEALRRITADVHSPPYARILGPLANSRDFREAYNCPVKEPTCELW